MSAAIARARRHPRAILATWLWFALWGLAAAWPIAVTVGQDFRGSPDGDAPLFRPGALDLLDYFWRGHALISTELGHLVVILPFALFGATIPLAILLVALADKARLRSPVRVIGWLAIFELAAFLVQGLSLWGAAELGSSTSSALSPSFGEVHADMGGVAVFALGVVLVLALSIYRDLASAALVRAEDSIGDALRTGARALTVRPFATLIAWLWRSAVGVLLIAFATVLAMRIGGKSGLFLIALALAHQSAIAWKVAWRASWLAASMRAVTSLNALGDESQAADDAALSDR